MFWYALISFALIFQTTPDTGKASYYSDRLIGRPMAGGGVYRKEAFTAAHPTLPFGTRVRVINLTNQESVEVVVKDRGPFIKGRIIDLSRAAAEKIDMIAQGVVMVRVEVLEGLSN